MSKRERRSARGVVPPDASTDDLAPVALIGCDAAGRITSWNRAATILLGWRQSDALGQRVIDIFGRDLMVGVGSERMHAKAVTSFGSTLDVEVLANADVAPGRAPGEAVFAAIPSARAESHLIADASPRVHNWAEAAAAIQGIGGHVQCLTVGLIGVRAVNRGYSRSTGDAVLREVLARLTRLAGDSGRAVRIAGTQFLVVTPVSVQLDGERVVFEMTVPINTSLGAVRIASCVGTGAGDSTSAYVLLDQADSALRRAALRGAGAVERLPRDSAVPESRHPRLSSLLIDAVARREIGVQFQPVVDLSTGTVVQFEALARWTSDQLGDVDPNLFIEAAEDAGLIHELGRCVLDATLDVVMNERLAGRWGDARVSLNMSAVQLAHPDLVNRVTAGLAKRSLSSGLLQIELTETRPVRADGPAVQHLRVLRELGVRVAVDDFGTGCANMSYLRDLPVDAIKIDRRFIAGVASSRADAAVVRSIISVAADLRIDVIAEGVESPEQHMALIRLGCPSAQGFLYASPRSAAELHRPIAIPQFTRSTSLPYPYDEDGRIAALHAADVLDTPPEPAYDDIVVRAAALCATPAALISLIDTDRQWVKAQLGAASEQIAREWSLCAHAICDDGLMEITDTQADHRFRDNPYVTADDGVRFYAGVPLCSSEGHSYGTLCVMDVVPRSLTDEQRVGLSRLAGRAAIMLELRQQKNQAHRASLRVDFALHERDEAQQTAAHLSHHDQLTGLVNRRTLIDRIEAALAEPADGARPVVLVCDIDGFRLVNDALGNEVGDRYLQEVARRLQDSVRSTETVARFDGDEYVVLVSTTDVAAIDALARRITERMSRPLTSAGCTDIVPSLSIGIAMGGHGATADSLLLDANDALRQAMSQGGGRTCRFEPVVPA